MLVFRVADQRLALPAEDVEKIVHYPRLLPLPFLPRALAGFLDVAGDAVPVVRLDRLLALPEEDLHLYSPLLLLKARPAVALAVHGVIRVLAATPDTRLRVESTRSLNGCVDAGIEAPEGVVYVLSRARLLAEEECQRLAALQAHAQRRLEDLQGAQG